MADATTITNPKEQLVKAIQGMKTGPLPGRLYLEICAKCGTCAKECPIYFGSPEKRMNPADRSDLIRKLYQESSTPLGKLLAAMMGQDEMTEEELKEWVDRFYECTACRRCATFCPFGIDNSVLTRKGRAILDKMGLTPPALLKVIEVSLKTGNTDGVGAKAMLGAIEFIEEEIEESCGIPIEIPVDNHDADIFFVPPSGDILVNPEAVMGIAKIFHQVGAKWTMSSKAFDGANFGLFTGDDKSMKLDNKRYVDEAKKLGVKTLMTGECGHAHRIMKFMMEKAKWWGELPFEVTNVMQYTAGLIRDGKLKFDKSKNPDPVTYHDPCNFSRSCDIVEEPRIIMKAACADFREMHPNRGDNWCCGGGGGLAAMDTIYDFRMKVSGMKKLEQIKETGAKFLAAPCANCKRQLTQLFEYHKLDVVVGGVHDVVDRAIILDKKAADRKSAAAETS